MIVRRFVHCSNKVKTRLFKSYCCPLYCSQLSMAHTEPTLATIASDSPRLPVDAFIVTSWQCSSLPSPSHAYLRLFYRVTTNIEEFCTISSRFNQDTLRSITTSITTSQDSMMDHDSTIAAYTFITMLLRTHYEALRTGIITKP